MRKISAAQQLEASKCLYVKSPQFFSDLDSKHNRHRTTPPPLPPKPSGLRPSRQLAPSPLGDIENCPPQPPEGSVTLKDDCGVSYPANGLPLNTTGCSQLLSTEPHRSQRDVDGRPIAAPRLSKLRPAAYSPGITSDCSLNETDGQQASTLVVDSATVAPDCDYSLRDPPTCTLSSPTFAVVPVAASLRDPLNLNCEPRNGGGGSCLSRSEPSSLNSPIDVDDARSANLRRPTKTAALPGLAGRGRCGSASYGAAGGFFESMGLEATLLEHMLATQMDSIVRRRLMHAGSRGSISTSFTAFSAQNFGAANSRSHSDSGSASSVNDAERSKRPLSLIENHAKVIKWIHRCSAAV